MTAMDRRMAIASIASGAMLAVTSRSLAAPRRRFFERIGRPIGLQIYTLGDEPAHDLDGVFARVAKIGYREVEMPQLYGRAPAEVKAAAARAGLTITSLHVPHASLFSSKEATLSGDIAKLVDELGALGVNQAVLPIVPFPEGFRPKSMETFGLDIMSAIAANGPDHWKRTAALLNEKAAALKPHGIALGYHNHNIEFAPIGPETGWSILARETDPKLVHFEVDVGWVAAAGLDPVKFLDQYRGRVRQMHVKDVLPSTKPNFAVHMAPTEVGSGKLDWAQILPAALRAGVRNFYVEQEPPFTLPRMDAAAKSYAYLAQLRA
jgi:sugar phosphate isomerase/epimerase